MILLKNPEKLRTDILSNFTITNCAGLVGYTKAYISSILSGTRNPNSDVAVKLCELLKKQFDDYFYIECVRK